MLITNHLHRLPILETTEHSDTILSVLTQSKILRYIATHESNRDYMNQTIADLKLGTFTNLITAESDTPLIEILRLFLSRHISSIPIVDEHSNID
jgi:CBS domain-containing protein